MGCFHQVHDGWVNTDITPNILIARLPFSARILHAVGGMSDVHFELHQKGVFKRVVYLDVTKRLPYATCSVECIFCSHLLEHLYPKQVTFLMSEAYRVLRPGGVFRASVPNLNWVISLYDPEDPSLFLDRMYELDMRRPKNSHKWMYNDCSLVKVFRDNRFKNVEVCEYQRGRLPDVEKMDSRPNESIFVEGIK